MNNIFELASGTVAGRDHRTIGKNNQDSRQTHIDEHCLVAVVTDGCGGGVKSEVGAILGARLAVEELSLLASACAGIDTAGTPLSFGNEDLEGARCAILGKLDEIVSMFGGSHSQFVNDHLLFTLVGAIVLPDISMFFSIGDGYLNVNGETISIGPFPDNEPPYISYGLVDSKIDPTLVKFKIHRAMPTAELSSFVVGTDGVIDLAAADAKPFPGRTDLIGPLDRLWREDRFFKNPDMLRRHLTLANGGVTDLNMPGYLKDDTTLVVGRRKKAVNV
jgi:hypothetical protein